MSINRTIDVESSIVRGCAACKRLGKPPSIYSLRPPPMPPLPLELLSSHAIVFKQAADFDPFVKCKLVTGGSNGLGARPVPLPPPAWPSTSQPSSGLQSFFSLAGLSSLASGVVSSSSSSSSSPTSPSSSSSYLFVIIVVISVLILFLLLFILFAFVLVYLTKMKLKQSSRTSNDTTSPSSTANHSGSSSGAPSPKDFSHHSSSSSTSSHRVDSNKTVSVFSLSSSSSSCAASSSSNSPNFIPTVTCYNQLSSPTKAAVTNDVNILNR